MFLNPALDLFGLIHFDWHNKWQMFEMKLRFHCFWHCIMVCIDQMDRLNRMYCITNKKKSISLMIDFLLASLNCDIRDD